MNRMENGESDLLEGMNRSIRSDVCLERENLLRRIVVLLFTSSIFPPRFVRADGIDLLLLALRDPEPTVRLLAAHALTRLAELGYRGQVKGAGAENELLRMRNDPYMPLRKFAERCLSTIREPDE
ncbi:MAG TPA: HEAT repeat domain-containing protein [Methanoregulaceae archaeon]|jgi:hypothetical protein|nr:hypothetical protein [Methanolinea sp.]MCC7566997.1 hypothetical protein [Methanoregulaceae archaeon]MDD5048429.1 HEAT repeat domain-containing protein [Methanoregulaceae archaeon]MDD5684663.1 HEAT repeat domain-containing protein [Methanoregulaceae archaeon]HOP66132.1 HEAT repeat domain-containing protein [Methanoregulaceae archaeon]